MAISPRHSAQPPVENCVKHFIDSKDLSAMSASASVFHMNGSATSIAVDDGAFVTIPDAQFLFHADFKRTGSDLTLTGTDGHRLVIPEYFKYDRLPTLLASDGAALTGDVVAALAGPLAPGQYAQVGGAQVPSDVPLIG